MAILHEGNNNCMRLRDGLKSYRGGVDMIKG